MKKLFFTLVLVFTLSMLVTSTAFADNGPHGGFTLTTDACAGCHRTHTATGPQLLTGAGYLICLTCHGTTGTGANTNVIDGVYTARRTAPPLPVGEGVAGVGLLAGGFTNALMDGTGVSATAPVSAATTSSHIYNGSTGTVWAYGPISATANNGQANTALSCMNCHDPHGKTGAGKTATYRILRVQPTGVVSTGATVPDVAGTKVYTIASTTGKYFTQTYAVAQSAALTSWCTQCHTRNLTTTGSGSTASGDAVFMYRHTTSSLAGADVRAPNGLACTTCHVAHGSPAQITGQAVGVGLAADSALLRLDNRGVCQSCHNK
jgi:predicted CXXCH cytochrome family protein